MLSKLADGLLSEENLKKIINRAPEIVGAIVNAIVAGVNAVADLAFTIIDKLVDYFFGEDADEHWANMLDVALKIVTLIIEGIEKNAKVEALKSTPKPTGNQNDNPSVTKEQFNNMEYTERVKFAEENPDLFNQYSEES